MAGPSPASSSPEPPLQRVAFGSCAFQWAEQPIFRAAVAAEPDVYLSLYGDFDGKKTFDVTPESLRAEWQKLADHPDWQHLTANVPVMGTWDNHDYSHHSAGEEFPLKAESQEIFLGFFGEPASSERRRTPGVYDAEVYYRWQLTPRLAVSPTLQLLVNPALDPELDRTWVLGVRARLAL